FVITNMTDEYLGLFVSVLEDGHAYQELIDLQTAPGRYYPKPQWVIYSQRITPDAPIELAPIQHVVGYDLEPGRHAIYFGTANNGLWFCAPLLVTDPSSSPPEIIEVRFDGSTCTATAPSVLPSGVRSFVLEDRTGEGLADVRTMAIADDHTYQDLLDLQDEEGEYVALPPWADWPLTTFEPIERELAENEIGKKLILEPGKHAIAVGTGKGTWFCGALQVTEP
ncbi:MAG: hypothetical protein ACN4GZ_14760, partial [Acidimicrobiales bacterium]